MLEYIKSAGHYTLYGTPVIYAVLVLCIKTSHLRSYPTVVDSPMYLSLIEWFIVAVVTAIAIFVLSLFYFILVSLGLDSSLVINIIGLMGFAILMIGIVVLRKKHNIDVG
jgi:hypothetical protein